MDGSENFNRGWDDYVSGFGSVWGEQWLGLEKIHCLTTRTARTEMRIDMADFRGDKKYAYYSFFMVGNVASKYKLQVAGYSGTAGNCIQYGSEGCMAVVQRTSMAWHSPHMTETMTCGLVTVDKALREDGGSTAARIHN